MMNADNVKTSLRIATLTSGYLKENLSQEEEDELFFWLSKNPENLEFFTSLLNEENMEEDYQLFNLANNDEARERVKSKLFPKETSSALSIKLWQRVISAACLVLIMGIGIYFYTSTNTANLIAHKQTVKTTDIQPGTNKATLKLADGTIIALNDMKSGKLVEQSGIEVTKTNDGQLVYKIKDQIAADHNTSFNTIETPRGGQYMIHLPDGSKVWLNSATKLIYPVSFANHNSRTVELVGEAYFEVTKDKMRPFKVKTSQYEVKVLGTNFNINSYKDEKSIKTTLLEGAVKIGEITLSPGQQAELIAGKMNVTTVNAQDAAAWKDGLFLFDGADLQTVIRQIARWYDLEVKYEGTIPHRNFDGKMYKHLKLSNTLDILRHAKVRFRMEDRTLIILP